MWEVVKELHREGAPLSHDELAERLHKSAWRVCVTLNHLKKIGLAECLQPSGRNSRNRKPGVWTLTEIGVESMAAMPNEKS
jgi:predicted transcriptional regulator